MSAALAWLRNAWPVTDTREPLVTAFRAFVETAHGKLMLEDLARYCNLRNSGFVGGDPYATAFNEGQRDVLLHILEMGGVDALLLTQPSNL